MAFRKTTYLGPLIGAVFVSLIAIAVLAASLYPLFSKESLPFFGAIIAAVASVLVFTIGRLAELFRDDAIRAEKVRDLLTAIHAEISAADYSADLQASSASEKYAVDMVSELDISEDVGVEIPFALPDESNFVFQSLRDDISLLPQSVIEPVVLFYKLTLQTNSYVNGLQNPLFRELAPHRRAKFVIDLVELNRAQSQEGDRALKQIEAYARDHDLLLPPSKETKARIGKVADDVNIDSQRWTGR